MSLRTTALGIAAIAPALLGQEPASVRVWLAVPDGAFRLVGPELHVGSGAEALLETAAGDYVLHFAPARGIKPASIPLALLPGARVTVATGGADRAGHSAPLLREDFETGLLAGWDTMAPDTHAWLVSEGMLRHPGESAATGDTDAHALLAGGSRWRDVYYEAVVRHSGGGGAGLLLRWSGEDDYYALTLDPEASTVRLERVVGGESLVLDEATCALRTGVGHRVACQGDGFRLQVWVDDVPLVQVLDGAHDRGRVGLFAAPAAKVAFDDVRVLPPVQPAPAIAAVAAGGECTVYGAAPEAVGLVAWVHFAMDRPWPPGLRDGHGLGPFLVTEGRRSWFLAEGRGIEGFVTPVGEDAAFTASFRWPETPALHGHVVFVETWIATPDGTEVRETLPRVRVVL